MKPFSKSPVCRQKGDILVILQLPQPIAFQE